MGNTVIPMFSGIVELLMRVGIALFLPLFMGQEGIYYAEIVAWTGALLYYCILAINGLNWGIDESGFSYQKC
ncbi:MAG: hypothetical protein ACLRWM_02040 [Streptococcus sp.]